MAVEGVTVIPNWLVRDRTFKMADKMVYAVLASHTGRDGAWEMSHETIASEACVSVSTVIRSLKALRLAGLVSWTKQIGQAGQSENVYRVHSSMPPVEPVGQNDSPTGSVILIQPDCHSDSPAQTPSQNDRAGSVTGTDRKKNPSLDLPSVGVGFVAAQAPTTPPNPEPKKRERGTRVDPEFVPSPRSRKLILGELVGVTSEMLLSEHDQFIDYWRARPGQGGVKLDWDATWRKWMRDANWTQVRRRMGIEQRSPKDDAIARHRTKHAEWRDRYGVAVIYDDDTEASVAARATGPVAS